MKQIGADGHGCGHTQSKDLPTTGGAYQELFGGSKNVDKYLAKFSLGDPDPGITVSPTSGLVTSEDGTMDSFTVVLNTQPIDDVTIGVDHTGLATFRIPLGSPSHFSRF